MMLHGPFDLLWINDFGFFQRCLIFDGFVMGEKIVIEGA
jgi:hypothetical protein